MTDLLRTGVQWMAAQLKSAASRTVTYRRGVATVSLSATIGQTRQELSDEQGGNRTEWTDRDYLIAPADLILSGSATEPAKGDQILDVEDGATRVYEVRVGDGTSPVWRWVDPHHSLMRVHCKYTGTE